jgi:tetratricopeptide (TPR) repeat protein
MIVDKLYPPLRVAKTEILTVKVKKPNAEIAVLAKQIVDGKANADVLTYSELMFASTLTPSLKEKEAIFKAATKKDGNWIAHNNLGGVYLAMAKEAEGAERNRLVEEATTQLEIAANKMKAPEVWSNMATAQIMQKNYEQAYASLLEGEKGSAREMISRNISSAKGVIEAKQGKYDLAVASLASGIVDNKDVTFDKGLSYLLKKEFDSADAAFDEVIKADKNYAMAHYAKAIVAARKNSESNVISNLKNAVSIDPSLKGKAINDLEFGRYKTAISNTLK